MLTSVSELWRTQCNNLTVVGFIDHVASITPNHPLFSVPIDDDVEEWRDVSYAQFSRAVDRAAHWIVETLGPPQQAFPTIHMILSHDLRCQIFLYAVIKTGYKPLQCHPMLSIEARLHLHRASNATIILCSEYTTALAKDVTTQETDTRVFVVEPLQFWLTDGEVKPFPYTKTASDAALDTFAIVHSSGTTGMPKCIQLTHRQMLHQAVSCVDSREEHKLIYAELSGRRVAILTPGGIAASIYTTGAFNFLYDYVSVLPRPQQQPADAFAAVLQHARIDAAIASPRIFPALIERQDVLQLMKERLRLLVYIGQPAPKAEGDTISKYTHLVSSYGSSEATIFPLHVTDPADWQYVCFDANFESEMRPYGELGYYELVLGRLRKTGLEQAPFTIFPEFQTWHMNDLFFKHPSKDLWRNIGRVEDLLQSEPPLPDQGGVASFCPNEMETILCRNEHVKSAMICANRRGRLAVIIEPELAFDTIKGTFDEYVASILPSAERATSICPVSAHIDPALIIIARAPLRAGVKGLPLRSAIIAEYKDVIDRAYAMTNGCDEMTELIQ